ncbi:MAG TPA: bestrophin family ion channel [Thermosynechococcaceae cyanobacterium]
MIPEKKWFQLALQIQGSVIPAVLPRTLICGLFGVLISALFFLDVPVALPTLASLIPNIVLGLLLVFRTNTAYDRFWEGRKIWGTLVNTVRNLTRQLWIAIQVESPEDQVEKIATLKMSVGFCVAMKLHLREEPIDELEPLVSAPQFLKLKSMNHPPLEVAFWIGDYLQQQHDRRKIDSYQLAALLKLLDTMVDCLGGCERILKTPIPLAYAIHLKQLLLLYCLSLPFQMVENLGWWTGTIVALISFTLFGIEEIGIEIENPFGHDANDLPLDTICATMLRNVEDLITLVPSRERFDSAP